MKYESKLSKKRKKKFDFCGKGLFEKLTKAKARAIIYRNEQVKFMYFVKTMKLNGCANRDEGTKASRDGAISFSVFQNYYFQNKD